MSRRETPGHEGTVDISVAICTRDRAVELGRTLEGLAAVNVPWGLTWEVLVVNNGSGDATPAVIARFSDRLPLREVWEPAPGLSNARNRAVDEARGDAIVWTDDDVSVAVDWLATYATAFARHPEYGFFGGPIRPRFETPPPAWLLAAWPNLAMYYAAREPPDPDGPVTPDYVPFGANFGIRSEIQRRYPYDPELGRTPRELRSGEEWDMLQRALADGVRGRWLTAAVEHRIGTERVTPDFVRAVARSMGRVGAEALGGEGARWRGRPVWLWRSFTRLTLRYWLARLARRPERWVPLALERARVRGQLDAARRPPGRGRERPNPVARDGAR